MTVDGAWRVAKGFFKGKRKMREVFKTSDKIHVCGFLFFGCELVMRQAEALGCEPLARSAVEDFFKIGFKRGEASPG